MAYGKPPFSHLHMLKKLQHITDPRYDIPFPKLDDVLLLDVLKRCLQRDPKLRPSIPGKEVEIRKLTFKIFCAILFCILPGLIPIQSEIKTQDNLKARLDKLS